MVRQGAAIGRGRADAGQVVVDDLDADCFTFHRPNRSPVTLRYSQISMWEPLKPPPTPLTVEETPRP